MNPDLIQTGLRCVFLWPVYLAISSRVQKAKQPTCFHLDVLFFLMTRVGCLVLLVLNLQWGKGIRKLLFGKDREMPRSALIRLFPKIRKTTDRMMGRNALNYAMCVIVNLSVKSNRFIFSVKWISTESVQEKSDTCRDSHLFSENSKSLAKGIHKAMKALCSWWKFIAIFPFMNFMIWMDLAMLFQLTTKCFQWCFCHWRIQYPLSFEKRENWKLTNCVFRSSGGPQFWWRSGLVAESFSRTCLF